MPITPYVVNPISVEQFSMVPLAKAKAKVSGIAAANSMLFNYNIDVKDEEYINPRVDEVNKVKSDVISRIMNDGVSEGLINDFLRLRKDYGAVQKDIQKAEMNRARKDLWYERIYQLHGKNPAHFDYVYNKEYGKWNGTFNADGSINEFNPDLGAAYFDIQGDAMNVFSKLPMEYIADIKKGEGKIETVTIDGKKQFMFVSSQDAQKYSNEKNIASTLNAILSDYADPNTIRGAYLQYMGLTPDDIAVQLKDIADSWTKTEIKGGQVQRQYIPGASVYGETKDNKDKPYNPERPNITTIKGKATSNVSETITPKTTEAVTTYRNEFRTGDVVTPSLVTYNKPMTEEEDKEYTAYIDNFTSDVASSTWLNTSVFPDMGVQPNTNLQETVQEMGEELMDEDLTNYQKNQIKYEKTLEYYNGISSYTKDYTIDTSPVLVENKPETAIKDYLNTHDIINGTVKVLDLDNKAVLNPSDDDDKELLQQIQFGLERFSRGEGTPYLSEGPEETSSWYNPFSWLEEDYQEMSYAQLIGRGTSDAELYTVYDKTRKKNVYVEETAGGYIIELREYNNEGNFVNKGRYVLGTNVGERRGLGIEQYSNTMKKMGELPYGKFAEGEYSYLGYDNEGNVVKATTPVIVERNAVDKVVVGYDGSLTTATKGQLVYYLSDGVPRLYNPNQVNEFTLSDKGYTATPQNNYKKNFTDKMAELQSANATDAVKQYYMSVIQRQAMLYQVQQQIRNQIQQQND